MFRGKSGKLTVRMSPTHLAWTTCLQPGSMDKMECKTGITNMMQSWCKLVRVFHDFYTKTLWADDKELTWKLLTLTQQISLMSSASLCCYPTWFGNNNSPLMETYKKLKIICNLNGVKFCQMVESGLIQIAQLDICPSLVLRNNEDKTEHPSHKPI